VGFGEVIVAVTGIGATAATLIVYLAMRADIIKRHGRGTDAGVQQAIEALRAEMAALKQHEAEAVLTFDSTLQTLEARLKHLEQRVLPVGTEGRASLGAGAAEELARVELTGGPRSR
jgi:uncharacterized protein YegL